MMPMSRRQRILIAVLVLVGLIPLAAQPTAADTALLAEAPQLSGLRDSDQNKAQQLSARITDSISAVEWLGPLAPIALSPFFGIACLCAISQYGGDALPFNSFISNNPVLQNSTILWIFVALTVLTSLPRLTKVSKPAAQAIDQLEAWAGIITILVIRFGPNLLAPDAGTATDPAVAIAAIPVAQIAGFTLPLDILMGIAAVINIIVINTIKFLFEVTIWLIPFPSVDAILEAANKSICVGLMAIYAYSPFLATVLNLLIFVACLVAYRWASRRVTYMRAIVFDPIWALIRPQYGTPTADSLTVFCHDDFASFPARTKLNLQKKENGWTLTRKSWFAPPKTIDLESSENHLAITKGLFVNKLLLTGPESGTFHFTRRFSGQLPQLASLIGADFEAPESQAGNPAVSNLEMT